MGNSKCNYYINRTGKVVRCFDNNYLITHIIKLNGVRNCNDMKIQKNMNRNNTNKKFLKVIV